MKFFRSYIVPLSIYCAVCSIQYGQILSGTVQNGRTGKPLPNVNILIPDEKQGTVTDKNGYYFFTGLRAGEYLIEFSHIGYSMRVEKVNISSNEELDIQLFPALIEMDAMVVTGTLTERYLKDTPVTTQVIKGDKLKNTGAADLSELIQESTGVNVAENQWGTGLELHGFDSENILIMLDGMKMVGRVNGQLDIAQIPIDQIDRIEIVKGATSALYGSEAMGGVINIFTKNPELPFTAQTENTIGSFGRRNHTVSLNQFRGKWDWAMNLGLRYFGGYDLDESTIWQEGSESAKRNIQFKINTTDLGPFNLRFDLHHFVEDQSLISSSVFKDKIHNDRSSIRSQIIYEKDHWEIGGSVMRSDYSHIFDRLVLKSGFLKKESLTKDELTSINIKIQREGSNHKLMSGVGFDYEGIDSDRVIEKRRVSDLKNLFIQDEIKLSQKWIFLGGLRLDQHSIYGQQVSPKISLMYKPEMISRIRLAYGEGFRAPSFKELFFDYSNISVGYHIVGNLDLKPETSQNLSLDIERWNTGKYHARINFFWNEISGLIDYNYLGLIDGQSTYQNVNLSSVRTRGIELDYTYFVLKDFHTWIGYSLLDTWDKENERLLPLKARHKVVAGLRYGFDSGIKFNLRLQHMSEKINWESDLAGNTVKMIIEPNTILHSNVSFPLPWGLQGFGGVKNLTNQVDKVWGPMPGREWYGGIRFGFNKEKKGK